MEARDESITIGCIEKVPSSRMTAEMWALRLLTEEMRVTRDTRGGGANARFSISASPEAGLI
jgi:hypothetical protein